MVPSTQILKDVNDFPLQIYWSSEELSYYTFIQREVSFTVSAVEDGPEDIGQVLKLA